MSWEVREALEALQERREKEAVGIQMRRKKVGGGWGKTKTETLFREMTLSWFSECLDGARLAWVAVALCRMLSGCQCSACSQGETAFLGSRLTLLLIRIDAGTRVSHLKSRSEGGCGPFDRSVN